MHDSPLALPNAPEQTVATQPRRRPVTPRLLKLQDVAMAIDEQYKVVAKWVSEGTLPAVRLPASVERPSWQCVRVPEVWFHRWQDMQNRREVVLTSLTDVEHRDEPPYLKVEEVSVAIGASRTAAYRLIKQGKIPVAQGSGGERRTELRVSRIRLDRWIWDLIHEAEVSWYRVPRSTEERGRAALVEVPQRAPIGGAR